MLRLLEPAVLWLFLFGLGLFTIYRGLVYSALQAKCRHRLSEIRDDLFKERMNGTLDHETPDVRALQCMLQVNFAVANTYSEEEFFDLDFKDLKRSDFDDFTKILKESDNHLVRNYFERMRENVVGWYFADRPFKMMVIMIGFICASYSDRAKAAAERRMKEPINEALSLIHCT